MPKMSSEATQATRRTLHGPTMGTRWSVTLDELSATNCDALRHELAAAVQRVDQQMSPWKADSDLVRLNQAPVESWVPLPPEMLAVLERALGVARLSAGAFDPTVGALVDAWGFGAASQQPDPAAIQAARSDGQVAGYTQLELDLTTGRTRKHAALQVDLCGIAKGYAVDCMVAVLRQRGVHHALVALDGELRAIGPQADGQPWPVAVESPEQGRRAVHGVIELQDLAIATSGDYRHFWDVGGTRLAHTMDPGRCAPAKNDIASVTVLAREAMDADAWATALLVAGTGAGFALAQRLGLEALWLLRREGRIVELGLGRFASEAGAAAGA